MAKLKISIHPLFIIVGILFLYLGFLPEFLVYFTAVVLHEFGHSIVASKLGYKLNKITLLPFGVALSGNNTTFFKNDEFLISIAGPLVNLVIVLIGMALWWIFPVTYAFTTNFVYANLVLLIFNLIPAYPLDGGRIFTSLLSKKKKRSDVMKLAKAITIVFSVLFFTLFIASSFAQINLTFGTISIFLFLGTFETDAAYEKTFSRLEKLNMISRGALLKTTAVTLDTPLYKLTSLLDRKSYNRFFVLNQNSKIVNVIFENELESYFLKYSPTDTLGEII